MEISPKKHAKQPTYVVKNIKNQNKTLKTIKTTKKHQQKPLNTTTPAHLRNSFKNCGFWQLARSEKGTYRQVTQLRRGSQWFSVVFADVFCCFSGFLVVLRVFWDFHDFPVKIHSCFKVDFMKTFSLTTMPGLLPEISINLVQLNMS